MPDRGDAGCGPLEQLRPTCFLPSIGKLFAKPVIFPIGRAMWATILVWLGSPPPTKTIGIICVRCRTARAAIPVIAKITSGPMFTSSSASAAIRPGSVPAKR